MAFVAKRNGVEVTINKLEDMEAGDVVPVGSGNNSRYLGEIAGDKVFVGRMNPDIVSRGITSSASVGDGRIERGNYDYTNFKRTPKNRLVYDLIDFILDEVGE